MAEKIKVEILGRVFELDSGDITPLEARSLEQFVAERMAQLQEQTRIVDSSKLAILGALNLADELMRLKSKYEKLNEELYQRSAAMIKILEEILKVKDGGPVYTKPARKEAEETASLF